MKRCPACRAFVPASICPECDRPLPLGERPGRGPRLRALVNVVASASAVVTLAACYGAPVVEPPPDFRFCDDPSTDFDGDMYCGEYDCDESDPERHAEAFDPEGDGLDQNCDGADGYFSGPDAGPTP